MDRLKKITENESKIKELEENIDSIVFDLTGGNDSDDEADSEEEYRRNDPSYYLNDLEEKKKKLLLENRKFRAEIEQEEFNRNFEVLSKTFKSGLVASDSESTSDNLSREIYSKILVRHIVKKEVETPINIGVFGDWGEGKSSFLKFMEREVEYLNEKKYMHTCYTHVVRYDASEYDEKNKIWASILSALFKEFEKNKGSFGKSIYAYNGLIKSLKENTLKYIINGLVLLLTIAWFVYFGSADSPIKKIKDSFLGVVGIVPLIMFVTNLLIPFVKQQLAFIQPLSSRVLSLIKFPDYKQELGSRENIKSTLKDLLKVWIEDKNERILLFIDELDRCSEKVISEFFNALQLLLSVKGITVVLSVNYKTVCYSLANNNKFYFEGAISNKEKIEFGVDYLKKYINIPIHLPQTCKYEEYITDIIIKINNDTSTLLDRYESNDGEHVNMTAEAESHKKAFDNEEEILIKSILKWINIQKHLTPREVKNIINILVISKEVIMIKNKEISAEKTVNFKKFIKWFLFHYFNRTSASKLIENIQNRKEEFKYNTIEESIKEEKLLDCIVDKEIMAKKMIKVLNNIRGDEVILFKEISTWFISDYESFNE